MALKDLIASGSAQLEELVESIVEPFVRYDIDKFEIVFLPKFSGVPIKNKILIFLSAALGWRFVCDIQREESFKPSEIERYLGIPGGSLRPALRDLRKGNLISDAAGSYFVRPASLGSIKREIENHSSESAPRSMPRAIKRNKVATTDSVGRSKRKSSNSTKSLGGPKAIFSSYIDDGYFRSPRTLADVQGRFHEEAILIPRTSLPSLLLDATRSGLLRRTKVKVGEKLVWTYLNKKAVT